MKSKTITFLTRKYPPQKGGMELFSWELTQRYPGKKRIIHAGKRQSDIVWVAPIFVFRALLCSRSTAVFHLGDLVLGPCAVFIKWFTRKPIVVTVHALELTYNGWGPKYHKLINWCLPYIDHFVAVSNYTRELLRKRGVPLEKITVITHGVGVPPKETANDHTNARVTIEDYVWQKHHKKIEEKILLLTVGRLVARKGVAWFIEQVMPTIAHSNVVYLIASTGPDEQRIRSLIQKNHLENTVVLLGKIHDELLHALYSAVDIFVMPNIPVAGDVEGFGFVAIEAAAHGLPVVASRMEGIPDAIHDSHNGILAIPANVQSYTKIIQHWIEHPEERKAFGETARAYTKEHFQWQEKIQEYTVLFSALISSRL